LRRFQREAETLENLQHPNIVRFYGIERDDFTVFMLMDYIKGITLKTSIFRAQGYPLNPVFIAHVMNSICSALHYAHQEKLVHCDIKPANIMIDESGKILLTDFGIARITDAATATMVGIGTPAYMPPELVQGDDPTLQSDIYSLGIVLYEMVTGGERPFIGEHAQITGSTSEKVRWEQINLHPPSPRQHNPNIPPAVESVILKCLAKNPSDRFATTLDLRNSLELAWENQSTLEATPTPGSQPSHQSKSQKVQWFQKFRGLTGATFPKWAYFGVGAILLLFLFFLWNNLSPIDPVEFPSLPAAGGRFDSQVNNTGNSPTLAGVIASESTPTQAVDSPIATALSETTSLPQITESSITLPSNQTPTSMPAPTQTSQPTTTDSNYATPMPQTYFPLSNCVASQLHLNDSAFVSYDTGTNKIRSEPDTHPSDNIIAQAEPGEVVQIIGGPVCNYGWLLWEVKTTRNEIGWTPETDGKEFWILPLTTRQLCSGALPSRLVVGKRAKVLEEPPDANLLRAEPNDSAEVIGRIQPGGWMKVLDGPRCSRGVTWWWVESQPSGVIGWTKEGSRTYYYLAPEP